MVMIWEKPRFDPTSTAIGGEESGLKDIFDATTAAMRLTENANSRLVALDRAYDKRIDDIQAATGAELANPISSGVGGPSTMAGFGVQEETDPEAEFQQKLEALAEQHPDARAIIAPQRPVSADAAGLAHEAETLSEDVLSRSPGGLLPWAARLAGGFYGAMHDPVNVGTLAIGPVAPAGAGVRGLLWMGVKQGVANATGEALIQPMVQSWRKEAGLQYGLSQAALNVGMAGAFGFAADVGVRGAIRGVRRAVGRPYLGPEPEPGSGAEPTGARLPYMTEDAQRASQASPSPFVLHSTAHPDPLAALEQAAKNAPEGSLLRRAADGDIEAQRELAKQTGADADPAIRRALDELEIERLFPAPLDIDDGAHLESLARAIRSESGAADLPAGDAIPAPVRRDMAALADESEGRTLTVEGRPVGFRAVDPREVVADAATFQFKSGGDAAGVTDRLRGVTRWDPLSAGKAIMFERLDGQMVIADGHQRLGLAKRLDSEGMDAKLDAYVFREADGWTPEDVRAYAALKNMRESSGTSLDMAQLMRDRPDLIDGSLPMRDGKLREAAMLARLSPEAFDAVVAGRLPPNFAALIGESVADASRHGGLIDEMAEAGLQNTGQARLYLKQLMELPTTTQTQITLFGEESFTRTVLVERAQVLDSALKTLRTDKRIFGLLEDQAKRIEGAGNVLAREANAAKAETSAQLADLIEKLATSRGTVATILNDAAASVTRGLDPRLASRAFVDRVADVLEREGLPGLVRADEAPDPVLAPVRMEDAAGPEAKAQTEDINWALELDDEIKFALRGVHSTNADFSRFDPGRLGKRDQGYYGRGVYMFPRSYAEAFGRRSVSGISYGSVGEGSRNIPLAVQSQKPFIIDTTDGLDIGKIKGDWAALKAHGWEHEGAPISLVLKKGGHPNLNASKAEIDAAEALKKDLPGLLDEHEALLQRATEIGGVWVATADGLERALARNESKSGVRAELEAILTKAKSIESKFEEEEQARRRLRPDQVAAKQFTDALNAAGYDAVIVQDAKNGPYEMVAIKPETVYSELSGDIMFALRAYHGSPHDDEIKFALHGAPEQAGEAQALRGFYSPAIRAAERLTQEKGTGAQFLAQITKVPGVKKDELDWMGLEEFLKGKKSITKAEVLDFMRAHQVRLDEKVLGGKKSDRALISGTVTPERFRRETGADEAAFPDAKIQFIEKFSTHGASFYVVKELESDTYSVLGAGLEKIGKASSRAEAEHIGQGWAASKDAGPRFSDYKVPGGENYREFLIRLPELGETKTRDLTAQETQDLADLQARLDETNARLAAAREENGSTWDLRDEAQFITRQIREIRQGAITQHPFRSKHFQDQEIAHLRVDDRTGPPGEKVLFINEVQSDLHQAGRKEGYSSSQGISDRQKERDALKAKIDDLNASLARANQSLVDAQRLEGGASLFTRGKHERKVREVVAHRSEIISQIKQAKDRLLTIGGDLSKKEVPDAPFKGDLWLELALKRALQYATENGYDAVSWARSDQIAKAVGAQPDKLALQYDSKIGKFYDKYTRKWGGKVESGLDIDTAQVPARRAHANAMLDALGDIAQAPDRMRAAAEKVGTNPLLRITPEMRASVETGQPLFARPSQRPATLRNTTLTTRAADEMASIRTEIDKAVAKSLPEGWRAEVRQSLVFGDLSERIRKRNPGVPPSLAIEGTFDPYERIIYVSMAATDPVERAFEEAGHALKSMRLIPEADYGILQAKATEIGARQRFKIDERYGKVYGARWRDDPARLEAALEEEAIMQMVAARARGDDFGKASNTIIDRLLKFLRAVRDMLGIKGFRNFEDVFADMTEGGFARVAGEPQGGTGERVPAFAFAGEMAKTADREALARAKQMAGDGASRDEIWAKTGWFKGVDGKWRFEIDDSSARFDINKVPQPEGQFGLASRYAREQGWSGRDIFDPRMSEEHRSAALAWARANMDKAETPHVPLRDALIHEELYEAYPDMRAINTARELSPKYKGTYQDSSKRMTVGGGIIGDDQKVNTSTALHESQHGIQSKEGLALGGNKDDASRAIGLTADAHVLEQARTIMFLADQMGGLEKYLEDFPRTLPDGTPYETAALYLAKNPKRLAQEEHKLFLKNNPEEAYRHLAGEVEARNVQARMNMSAAERRATPPWLTQDVPDVHQIVRGAGAADDAFIARAEAASEIMMSLPDEGKAKTPEAGAEAKPAEQPATEGKPKSASSAGKTSGPALPGGRESKRIRNLINQAAAEGRLSREDAQALTDRLDALEQFHKDGGKAKQQLTKEITAEAEQRKRQKALAEVRRRAIGQMLIGFRDARGQSDPARAMQALIENLGQHELPQGFVDVAGHQRAIYGLALADLDAMLTEFRKTLVTGQTRNKARLSNVVRELHGEKTGDELAASFAIAVAKVTEDLRQRFNAAGGNIQKRKDWHMPQSHDKVAMLKAGKQAWVDFIEPLLDLKWMTHPLTGDAMPPAHVRRMLGDIWDNLVSDGWHEREASMAFRGLSAIANTRADPRSLLFANADAWMKYSKRFGSGDDALAILVSHIRGMTKDIAAMEVLGPNPKAMLTYIAQFVEQQAKLRRAGMEAHFPTVSEITGRPLRAGGSILARDPVSGYANSMIKRAENMWDVYSGAASAPVNAPAAALSQTVRNVNVATKLGGATVSALSDPFWQIAARKFAGLPATKIVSDMVKQIGLAGEREARRAGVIAETYLHMHNEGAREGAALSATKISGYLADRVLSLSMLNAVTRYGNHAMAMGIQAHLADMVGKAFRDLDPRLQRMFRRWGLEASDWDAIRLDAGGRAREVDFLSPADIRRQLVDGGGDPSIAERYLAMTLGEAQYATLTGSITSQAVMYGNLRAGTAQRELWAMFMQFKSFAVNLALLQIGRMAREFVSQGFWRGAQYAAYALTAATVGGALIEQLQQLRNGKDPRDMRTAEFWGTAVIRSGGLSIWGDLLYASENRFGGGIAQTIAGPAASSLNDILNLTYGSAKKSLPFNDDKVRTNFGRELSNFVKRYTPGSSIWYVRTAWERVLMDNLQRMLDPEADASFRRKVQNAKRDYRQQFWWQPGQARPARLPDLGAVAGSR